MTIIDRYIASLFLKNFVLAVLALTFIFMFQALFADLYDHAYTAGQILYYHALSLPQVSVQMMPPCVLLATVFTLSSLARTNELTACFAVGVGVRRIMGLVLSLVFVIACFMLVMQDRVLPVAFRARTSYYYRDMQHRADFFLDLKQDKIWYRSQRLIYNLQRFDPKTQMIYGMAIYTFNEDFKLVQVVDAAKARYEPRGWRLMDGSVTVFSDEDPFPITQQFKEKEMQIAQTPKDFQEIEKEVDGLRLKELFRYLKRMRAAGADTKGYEVKFHARISMSFIPIVMCLLGFPFSMSGRREGSLARDLGLCLVVTFFYWMFYSVGLSLGTNGAVPPPVAAWAPSVVFLGVAALLMARRRA